MDEVLTEMMQAAAIAHEFFETLVDAGFTEDQALKLVGFAMRTDRSE